MGSCLSPTFERRYCACTFGEVDFVAVSVAFAFGMGACALPFFFFFASPPSVVARYTARHLLLTCREVGQPPEVLR